jgi:hypothetical protein
MAFSPSKPKTKRKKPSSKTSAVAICNLIIDFFDGEVQEMKAAKEWNASHSRTQNEQSKLFGAKAASVRP